MREHDGLAMSSRNSYFDVNGRKKALALYNSLKKAANLLEKGVRERKAILDAMKTEIFNTAPDADIDYIEIADLSNLRPIREICGDMIIALAVRIDGVRLIDNFRFHLGRCRQ
jgi:pantoate--beta-alanine ligase